MHTLIVKLHQRWINSQNKLNQINTYVQKAKVDIFSLSSTPEEQIKESINNIFLEFIGQIEEALAFIKKPTLSAINSFQESKDFSKGQFVINSQASQDFETAQNLIKTKQMQNKTGTNFTQNILDDMRLKESSTTSQNTVPNTADKVRDVNEDLSKGELILLQSILQGNKISKATQNIRGNSKLRSKKKLKARYRKHTYFTELSLSGLDPYKQPLNENMKFDQTSFKNINRQLQGHIQGKRNAKKNEITTNIQSDVAKENFVKKRKPNISSFIPKVNDGEMKLKNYISTVLNLETEFDDLLDTSLIRKIVNMIMCRQDIRKFAVKCQQFQITEETLSMILNASMSTLGLANCLNQIKKDNEIDNFIPKIIELLSWVCEVERCTLYLYNSEKACLYIKATTGRVRENVEIPTK